MRETQPGEFSLIYNNEQGIPNPVVLTVEKHEVLQQIVNKLLRPVVVVPTVVVKYADEVSEEHF